MSPKKKASKQVMADTKIEEIRVAVRGAIKTLATIKSDRPAGIQSAMPNPARDRATVWPADRDADGKVIKVSAGLAHRNTTAKPIVRYAIRTAPAMHRARMRQSGARQGISLSRS